jgi:hypothetical protein
MIRTATRHDSREVRILLSRSRKDSPIQYAAEGNIDWSSKHATERATDHLVVFGHGG